MQEHLYKYFQTEGHKGFLSEASVTLIDKRDGRNQKKRIIYWMRILKTIEPYGLNVAYSMWLAHTLFRLSIYHYFRSIIIFIGFYFYNSLELLYIVTI